MRLKRWFIGALVGSLVLVGCSTPAPKVESLPPGDAANGAILFAQPIDGMPTCSACHSLDGTVIVGPSLQGYASVAATRTDLSAEAYTQQSIVQPVAHIVSGFPNAMYGQYAKLTPQQQADLIAYLLTLS